MKFTKFAIEHGFQPTDALFYIVQGSFTLTIDGEECVVSKNNIVSFPSNMEFKRKILEPLTLYNVRYVRDREVFGGKLEVKNHTRILSTLSYMISLSQLPCADESITQHYLEDIFLQLKTEQMLKLPLCDSIVADAISCFECSLDKKIYINDIAESIGVSVSGLMWHFNKALGVTPMRYFNIMRMKKAEELLVTTNDSLSRIAAECGFDNAFYFSNAFKKEYQIRPSDFRKKYRL